jgi:hypothetical protein
MLLRNILITNKTVKYYFRITFRIQYFICHSSEMSLAWTTNIVTQLTKFQKGMKMAEPETVGHGVVNWWILKP